MFFSVLQELCGIICVKLNQREKTYFAIDLMLNLWYHMTVINQFLQLRDSEVNFKDGKV